jgi:cell division protein FtsN
MSVTYTTDRNPPYGDHPEAVAEEPFIPRYARTAKTGGARRGKIKTWMILAPVGALVLGGVAAVMLMDGGEETAAPLAEPAATAPVLPAIPASEAAVAPLTSASTPAPVEAAPVAAPPAARETPARPAAPARRVETPAPASRIETPAPAVTPRLNTAPAASPTTTLNTTPATPTPAQPPAPAIVVEPLS